MICQDEKFCFYSGSGKRVTFLRQLFSPLKNEDIIYIIYVYNLKSKYIRYTQIEKCLTQNILEVGSLSQIRIW